jgi:hypothetical protein
VWGIGISTDQNADGNGVDKDRDDAVSRAGPRFDHWHHMHFPMCAHNRAVHRDHKDGVVEPGGMPVPFWMRQEDGDPQARTLWQKRTIQESGWGTIHAVPMRRVNW